MQTSTTKARSWRQVLLWEAGCVSAEMGGVGVGLWLGLGLDDWTAGGIMLWIVCLVSYFVRSSHYGGDSVPPTSA